MRNRHLYALFIWLQFICPTLSAQHKLYVSSSGNDANAGTIAFPLKTPAAAIEKINRSKQSHIAILFRQGTYHLDETLSLDNNSLQGKTVSLAAYKNENVTFSAGRKLSLKWEKHTGNIWKSRIENAGFESLFINGIPQILARYPNYDSTARVFNGTAEDAISPEKIAKWKNPAGGYLHALHQGEWGSFHYRIKGIVNGKADLEGGWQNNRPAPLHPKYRFVENIFEELDAPGEWYYDKNDETLYFYPDPRIDLDKANIEVSNLKHILEVKGTPEKPVHNVTVKGIRFEHTARTIMDHYEPLLRSDWMIYRGGAVLMENTENCIVEDSEFSFLGGNAILFSGYNHASGVTGSHFHDISASAICFVGDSSAVRSPAFGYDNFVQYSKIDKTPGPKNNRFPSNCFAENNLIHDIGKIEKQATAVQIEMASEILVSHNTIYRVPRAGINIGDGCWGGHLIENNDVFETVLETGDHGAFNSWGRDRFWHPNRKTMDSLVLLHPELIFLDAQKTVVIRNNRFRCDHGWDIDLDDGSSNYHIYNNVCLSGGLKFREGFRRVAENNILINNSFHPHVWFKNSGDIFRKNIVMRPYFPIMVTDWGKEVNHNLFPDKAALASAQALNIDRDSKSGDPNFVGAKHGNYHVKSASPALNIGFKNFPMNNFGVTKASFRKMAAKVDFPVLLNAALEMELQETIWLGAKIRNVNGLGDRSAFGLPDEKGVVLVEIPASSILTKSTLQAGDVIRTANNEEAGNVVRLEAIRQQYNWTGKLNLEILRNQQVLKIDVTLK
ncbi:Right handed beta helix region [Dyadobacter koreensis]|uniref:Right handed beta helix region n=1 Tax=Dyadobacter koreensis TaxID=408657 RepID=A0A1H6YX20_9BACT|nr:PDZ domain-containing protein [Dyadobacter koreensis]SEJ45813.1 Right handed beta helix region [Dyadobacter koreensis]